MDTSTNDDDVVPPLFSPESLRDPYPTYRHHLKGPRVQPLAARPGTFLVFGYHDCISLFRDSRITSVRPPHTLTGVPGAVPLEFEPLVNHMRRWLLQMDPPRHTILRKLMNPGFSPINVERLRPKVEAIVGRLLDQMQQSAEPDIIRDLAYPLPVQVIAGMLGLPDEFHGRCIELTNIIAQWFGNVLRTPEKARLAQAAILELEDHFATLIRTAKHRSDDNLMSLLIAAAQDDEKLSEADLYAQCVMLLFAGHETTRHLIGNGMYSLLSDVEVLNDVRANASVIPNAIEELLRFESPIQAVPRGVRENIDFAGDVIPAGSSLVFMVGAAQRDPRQYVDPDRLDVRRQHIRHFGFGGDAHACLGAALARMETQVAIGSLLRRFPHLTLPDEQPEWGPNFAIRGIKALRVEFGDRAL
jgi:cytochrome P450